MLRLVLGSTSPYRKLLLEKLQLPFETAAPGVDETPLAGESAADLVLRLAAAKAHAVAVRFPASLVIGADEVGELDGMILGKPENHANAIRQLRLMSGQRVRFMTGLALLNTQTQQIQTCVEPFEVLFRELTDGDIEAYLQKDQPYHCAGSLKAEGIGITLIRELHGADPAALLGLPLIRLVDMLKTEGVDPLKR